MTTKNELAKPTRIDKPHVRIESRHVEKNGSVQTRHYDLANHRGRINLMNLIVWAMNNGVEINLTPKS